MTDRTRLDLWFVLMVGGMLAPVATEASGDESTRAADAAFQSRVAPLLERYCYRCHGDQEQRAGLNLQAFEDAQSVVEQRDLWELIQFFVEDGDMPPPGVEPRPGEDEVDEISGWIRATLSQVDCELPNPGRVTLRRLNRTEYDNTIRDLLALDFRPGRDFPADEVGYGFDNIGDVLSIDPLLMEKYLRAAEEIARRAIDVAGPTTGEETGWWGRRLRRAGGERFGDDDRILTTQGELTVEHDFAADGTYWLQARAYGHQAGDEPVRMAFKVDGETVGEVEVSNERSRNFEVVARLEGGRRRFSVAFVNDYFDPEAEDPERRDRNLIVRRLEIRGPGDPIVVREAERLGDDVGGSEYRGKGRLLASNGDVAFRHEFPRDGEYRIRVRAFGQQAGPDPARLAFRVDGEVVDAAEVPATEDAPGTYEARVELKRGRHRIAAAFLNDYFQPDHEDEHLRGDRNLVIDAFEIVGPVESYYGTLPESHKRIVLDRPLSGRYDAVARRSLRRLANRADRRPATEGEVRRLLELFRMVRRDGGSFEESMRVAVQAVLVSPNFLYRVEYGRAPDPGRPGGARPLSDWELASRLSYFLWSSMPDEELFRLALEKKLAEPAVLEAQARRMLRDPKSEALVANFAGQWLQIRNLDDFQPDPERFPEFDDELRVAMRRETELFFGSIVREDRSIFAMLDARDTFLNERLADHYGIGGVEGDHFRKVALSEDSPRGGILTQASILAITSNPTRTSPVKRGKYVLDQILGTPIPPPPPDVPELEEGPELTGTLRERMEQHSTNPGCASCHRRMDPIGFGLENFDALGRWRDYEGEATIDASGTLPSGESFDGPSSLKALLLERREQFARTLTEQLMTYALGRGLEYFDRCAVDRILVRLDEDDRFGRLVAEIVTSEPFRLRNGDEAGD